MVHLQLLLEIAQFLLLVVFLLRSLDIPLDKMELMVVLVLVVLVDLVHFSMEKVEMV